MIESITSDLASSALVYHRSPRPGKLEVQATKPLATQRDLALAYSPGVAAACLAIVADPASVAELTVRQNLVAVVSNGTAVLGLGNIGPLAAKPVMKGKAVLFKKFAGIDVFDIEIAETDVDRLVDVIAALEPTFGDINLEDIKAPQCFEVERKLRERTDFVAYEETLSRFVFRSGFIMKPLMQAAKANPKRVIYAEGEDERVLRAVQTIVEEGIAKPILIGRPEVIDMRLDRFGLSVRRGRDFELINPNEDPRYRDYVATYLESAGRHGITPKAARTLVRTNSTVIAAIAVKRGDADAMLCGLDGRFNQRLRYIKDLIGLVQTDLSAMCLVITNKGVFFLADTHVRRDPTAPEIAEMVLMCAAHVRRFGIEPKIAFVSHSDFGSDDTPSALKMRHALEILRQRSPDVEADGEMQANTALSQAMRDLVLPSSRLKGEANLLVMPNLDAANIAYTMTMIMADALLIGPILIGAAKPAHILTPSVTARGIINMTAVSVAEAQGESQTETQKAICRVSLV